jgi:hypothetical protein
MKSAADGSKNLNFHAKVMHQLIGLCSVRLSGDLKQRMNSDK